MTDITQFYGDVLDKKSIVQRIECEYKKGKSYRYFTDNFISEVYYNNISDESKHCYLKTKYLPSQRFSSKLYDVCVLVKKDFKYEVGGAILSAYCTLTAGLLESSCNHVAGLRLYHKMGSGVLIIKWRGRGYDFHVSAFTENGMLVQSPVSNGNVPFMEKSNH